MSWPLTVVARLSGKVLVLIKVVALHWARLILGWMTVCGWVSHLNVASHLGQLPSAGVDTNLPGWG